MSRRFGRNQRRKLREHLAAEQAEKFSMRTELAMRGGALRAASSKISELEERLELARRYLGENSPAFPPKSYDFDYKPYRDARLYIPSRTGESEAIAMQVVRSDSDDPRDQVHFRLFAGPEQWGYAITKRALESAPREVIARHIVVALVDMMLDKMNTNPR